MADLTSIHQVLAGRFNSLAAAAEQRFGAGAISIVSGFRTHEQQAKLFKKKGPKWAARPGSSNHEYGAAIDLRYKGDKVEAWVHANASRFGLWFPMKHEPWHIEAVGLNRRTIGNVQTEDEPAFDAESWTEPPEEEDNFGVLLRLLGQDVDLDSTPVGQMFNQRIGGSSGGFSDGDMASVLKVAHAAGFRGRGLIEAAATAFPESGGRASAHNDNAKTGDNSYGLWQINMLGRLQADRLQQFGIASNEQLFDPMTNARAAYIVSNGGKNFRPWTANRQGKHRPYMDDAERVARQLGLV